MANRLKTQRDAFSSESPTSNRGSAFQGDISQVSLSTVLTLLELERRSGRLKVKSDGRRGEIDLQEGTLVAASLGGKLGDARELLRELLRWKRGSFAFKPSLDSPKKPLVRQNLGGLLLEAMRLEDESQR
jgi:hypothetical protein